MYSNDIMLWREVLKNAYRAAENGEVPVGAIVVDNEKNKIVSKGWNQVNLLQDPTAHAEMLAINPLSYLPYCFFNIISPFMTLLFAYFKIRIKTLNK